MTMRKPPRPVDAFIAGAENPPPAANHPTAPAADLSAVPMPRPRARSTVKLDRAFQLRLTSDELDQIHAAAEARGVSANVLLRQIIIPAIRDLVK